MSYHRRHTRGSLGDLTSILSTGIDVATDPYTAELVCQIQTLQGLAHGQQPPPCAQVPDGTPDSAGIATGVKIMRGYVYAKQNPWVFPVAIAAAIGLPLLLGYELGRGSK